MYSYYFTIDGRVGIKAEDDVHPADRLFGNDRQQISFLDLG